MLQPHHQRWRRLETRWQNVIPLLVILPGYVIGVVQSAVSLLIQSLPMHHGINCETLPHRWDVSIYTTSFHQLWNMSPAEGLVVVSFHDQRAGTSTTPRLPLCRSHPNILSGRMESVKSPIHNLAIIPHDVYLKLIFLINVIWKVSIFILLGGRMSSSHRAAVSPPWWEDAFKAATSISGFILRVLNGIFEQIFLFLLFWYS